MDVAPRPHDLEDPLGYPRAAAVASKRSVRRSRTILLVDDEADILESLGSVLQRQMRDVKVLTAPSGAEGLVHVRSQEIGVILTDFRMPGMNGFEFIERARRVDPAVPVIMMTAYPDPEIVERAKGEFGIPLVLIKPFSATQMVDVLRAVLAGTLLASP